MFVTIKENYRTDNTFIHAFRYNDVERMTYEQMDKTLTIYFKNGRNLQSYNIPEREFCEFVEKLKEEK